MGSISHISHPPKESPAEFVWAGIAMLLIEGSPERHF
jgi:hypothetical protein